MKRNLFLSVFSKKNLKSFIGLALFCACIIGFNYASIAAGITLAAIFTTHSGIGDIRGSIGGDVFSKNHFNNFWRSKVKPVNPQTTYQNAVRVTLRFLSKNWGTTLTDIQRAIWNSVASSCRFYNSLGQSYSPTGENLYIRNNMLLKATNSTLITDCPSKLTDDVAPMTSWSVVINTVPGSEAMTFVFTPIIPTGVKVLMASTGVSSPGITNNKNFKDFLICDSSFLTGDTIKSAWMARFGAFPRTGEKVFYKITLINSATGWSCLPTTYVETAAL